MLYEIDGIKINFPEIIMILATAESGLIGNNGRMPWKSSIDLNHWFKAHTLGWPVIIGRETAESMPTFPLKNRINILLSSKYEYMDKMKYDRLDGKGGYVSTEFADAINFIRNYDKAFVIGGKQIYLKALETTKLIAPLDSCDGDEIGAYKGYIKRVLKKDPARIPEVSRRAEILDSMPLVDTVIRTVFPDGYVDGNVYFKELSPVLKEQFFLNKYAEFTLEHRTNESVYVSKTGEWCKFKNSELYCADKDYCSEEHCPNIPNQFRGTLAHNLKESDTAFPWIKFEIWRRKQNPGK